MAIATPMENVNWFMSPLVQDKIMAVMTC